MSTGERQVGEPRRVVQEVFDNVGPTSSVEVARLPAILFKTRGPLVKEATIRKLAEPPPETVEQRLERLEARVAELEEQLDAQSERKRWR